MKTQHSQPTTKADSLPGNDQGQKLSIIYKVLESLAPRVAESHPGLVRLIQQYVLDETDEDFRLHLESYLAALQKRGEISYPEDLLMAIEGMRITKRDLNLKSLSELEQFGKVDKAVYQKKIAQYLNQMHAGELPISPEGPKGNNKLM